MIGAYKAARQIIEDYASGASTIPQVALDGAKSTVAYGIIAGTSTRMSTAASAWESAYHGKGVDYGKWLLAQVDKVTLADVLHALKRYLVPLFDASCTNLAATCPTNKLDADVDALRELLGVDVRKLQEEGLFTAFGEASVDDDDANERKRPKVAASQSNTRSGAAAFSWAKQFKCECPKCGPMEAPSV